MPPQSEKPIPEPGSIPGNPPSNGMPAEAVPGPPDWGALDASVPPNFVSVEPVKLPAGTQLYRVFSAPSEADPYPAWEVGSWFARDPLPATESEWRGGYAIEESWNGGQYYVEWTVPAETYAWVGPAALQYGEFTNGERAPGWYLPGGLTQVYIPPDKVGGAWVSKTTPWTPSVEPETVAKPPDVADQGYAGRRRRRRARSADLWSAAGLQAGIRRSSSMPARTRAWPTGGRRYQFVIEPSGRK